MRSSDPIATGRRGGAGAIRPPKGRRGFTLLETALAMVIVMVGVLAMIEAQQGFIHSNSWSSHEATATYLANEIRERMRNLPRHDPVTGLSLVSGNVVGWGREAGEVTVQDFDDVDDYDAVTFGTGGNFDGPIDAFGTVISEIDGNGRVVIDPNTGQPMPLLGWSQTVEVWKIPAYNFAGDPLQLNAIEGPNGSFPGRPVDRYPLRVRVSIRYQGPLDPQAETVTTMTWVVPVE